MKSQSQNSLSEYSEKSISWEPLTLHRRWRTGVGDETNPCRYCGLKSLAGSGVDLEDLHSPTSFNTFQMESRNDPVVGKAEGEVLVRVDVLASSSGSFPFVVPLAAVGYLYFAGSISRPLVWSFCVNLPSVLFPGLFGKSATADGALKPLGKPLSASCDPIGASRTGS
jgi:hypothetical protein